MRLRVCVQRHELPPVKLLIKAPDQQPAPISKLLEQVDTLVPLESEGWGLEDYVVTVQGYQCLHYIDLHSILSENDEVSIRALQTNDIKTRIASGRMQISGNGIHLLDGIPFGRQAIRRPHRPEVHIPPLKRRRLLEDVHQDATTNIESQSEQVEVTSALENGKVGGENVYQSDDDEEEDEDYEAMEAEPNTAVLDKLDQPQAQSLGHMDMQRVTRRTSVQFAEPVATSYLENGELSEEDDDDDDDADFSIEDDSEADDSDELSSESEDVQAPEDKTLIMKRVRLKARPLSVELLQSASSASTSSSESTSSESSSDEDTDSAASVANLDRKLTELRTGKSAPKQVHTGGIPGQGKRDTKERNKRRKARKRLDHLKKIEKLHSNATMADLRLFEAEERGDIPSKFEVYGRFEDDQVRPPAIPDVISNASAPHESGDSLDGANALPTNNPATNLHILEQLLHLQPEDPLATSPLTDNEPPEELPATTVSATQDSPTPQLRSAVTSQSRLDLASSRRLLFGSLGVRAPRTKTEEDKLRAKLGEKSKIINSRTTIIRGDQAEPAEPEDDNDLSDAWQSRINLTAVECVEEGVVLSAPPFPFYQRWDPQQHLRSKKRKRQSLVAADTNPDEEEEWAGLDYDDPVTAVESSQVEDDPSELPELPADLTSYPRPVKDDCKSGAIIAFTRMEVSKVTNWQPGIAPMRTAKINSVEDDVLVLSLAKRDRPQAQYDERGSRIYEKHEMPAEEGEDEGIVEVAFDELTEAYLLQSADESSLASASMIPDSVPPVAQAEAIAGVNSPNWESDAAIDEIQSDESQELQAAQHQMATSASDDSNKLIEASA